MKDVSCIIVNYNSLEFTKKCIETILTFTSKLINYEIVLVDNASKAKEVILLDSYIESLCSNKIKFVKSKINTGFGGGNMFGVQHSSNAKYYAFINNDCEFESDLLLPLFDYMELNTDVGVCSPQMLNGNREFVPTHSPFTTLKKEILGNRFLEKYCNYPKRKEILDNETEVDLVIGSFMFVRSSSFNTVGGFDTNIFLYFEETDLCFRIKKIGQKTVLLPQYSYIHHISKSTGSNKNPKIQIEFLISKLYIVLKNSGYTHYLILKNFFRIKFFFSSLFKKRKRVLFKNLFFCNSDLVNSLKQRQSILY